MQEENLRKAVRDLRMSIRSESGLAISQTEFGKLIGKSLPTVQRYETLRGPSGKVLVDLAALARQNGREDLNLLFTEAFVKELTPEHRRTGNLDHETEAACIALVAALQRN